MNDRTLREGRAVKDETDYFLFINSCRADSDDIVLRPAVQLENAIADEVTVFIRSKVAIEMG